MEAAGAGGNFSGAGNDINATDVVAQSSRTDPQNGTRTRGLAKPTFSRGYFLTEINLDSYNTEGVTVNRGPNAILFGVGSPAGVVEQTMARANLLRDRNKIELRYGNNDSLRSTVDFNRVLIPKKLAVRVAGLREREEFNQRPAFEDKKRIYGALNFAPFKSTALRVNFESGNTVADSFPGTPPPTVAGEVKTYSAVLRWPRKLIKLPEGTDVSLSYNRSSNFTPSGGRYDAFGGSLPSPEGGTKEYGVAVSAFHDKLTVRVNHFETSVKGQSFNPIAFQNAQWFGLAQTARVWAEEANTNPHLTAMRNADIALLFSALPPDFKAANNYEVNGTAPNIAATVTRISGATDTTDYVAKGTELELVYNPTRNWRILANVAKQETVLSNMLPGTPLPANVQTYGQWLDQNVYILFATTVATDGVASAEQRKWRANLVTNYTFGRGSILGDRLKGLFFLLPRGDVRLKCAR